MDQVFVDVCSEKMLIMLDGSCRCWQTLSFLNHSQGGWKISEFHFEDPTLLSDQFSIFHDRVQWNVIH